jgi:hypothetical protein
MSIGHNSEALALRLTMAGGNHERALASSPADLDSPDPANVKLEFTSPIVIYLLLYNR